MCLGREGGLCESGGWGVGWLKGHCVTCRGQRTCGFRVDQPGLQTDAKENL